MSICDGVQCFDYFGGQTVNLRMFTIEYDARRVPHEANKYKF